MDGINGITGGYSLAVLAPLIYLNQQFNFIDMPFLYVTELSLLVFCFFNFRKKAKCFAGDAGSITIAFVLLFALDKLILQTDDFSYIIFLAVYGADSVLTICHRIQLHENLGEAHRKHAYQLMANELKIPPYTGFSAIYGYSARDFIRHDFLPDQSLYLSRNSDYCIDDYISPFYEEELSSS